MAETERIVIPRCIGCGAMRELERCEAGCTEQYLDLVAAADSDALAAGMRSARARLERALPVVRQLAEQPPADGEWRRAYLAAAEAARHLSRELPASTGPEPAADGALRIGVWRCSECGAVDAPQECLGICIWRRFEWVGAAHYEARLAQADAIGELERRVFGLLRRVAFATPREDAWERSWHALSREAQGLIERWAQTNEQLEVDV